VKNIKQISYFPSNRCLTLVHIVIQLWYIMLLNYVAYIGILFETLFAVV